MNVPFHEIVAAVFGAGALAITGALLLTGAAVPAELWALVASMASFVFGSRIPTNGSRPAMFGTSVTGTGMPRPE